MLLLNRGANVNSVNKGKVTPLILAAREGYKSMVQLLLDKGAKVNARDIIIGWTPLHWAIAFKGGHKEVVEQLIAYGAEINAKDNNGSTPLHIACAGNRGDIAELLLSKGAKVNEKNNQGKTPLELTENEAIKTLLREHGTK